MSEALLRDWFPVFDKTGSWSAGIQYPNSNGTNPFKLDSNRFGLHFTYKRGTESALIFDFQIESSTAGVWADLVAGDVTSTSYDTNSAFTISVVGTLGVTIHKALPFTDSLTPGPSIFGKKMRIGVQFTGTTDSTTRVAIELAPVSE